MQSTKIIAALTLSLTLAACGGGGGGGGGSSPPANNDDSGGGSGNNNGGQTGNPPAAGRVTSENAKPLAALGVGTSSTASSAGSFAGGQGGGQGGGASASPVQQFGTSTRAVFVSDPLPCGLPSLGGSGSITLTQNDLDDDGVVSAGDGLTITFTDCGFPGDDEVTSGTLNFDFATVTGSLDSAPYAFTGEASIEDMVSRYTDGTVETVNGVVQLAVESTDGITERSHGTTNNMTSTGSKAGTVVLRNFEFDSIDDLNTLTSLESANGTIESSVYGTFQLEQIDPWQYLNDADTPSTGSAKLTGAENTSLTIQAISETVARLLVDSNGDGATDDTIDTTWAELEDLL